MEKNKYTLITIIVLLVAILPFSIYGTYKHVITNTNFKREFRFNGKLWFYSGKKLLGKYTCKSKKCDYATYANEKKSSIINNNYAFITDDEKILLYNIKTESVIQQYDAVNDDPSSNNYYVMELAENDSEEWGALEITNDVINKISPKYSSIYYLNGSYVGLKDGYYELLDVKTPGQEEKVFSSVYKIADFNKRFIIVIKEEPSCSTCTDLIKKELLYDYNNILYFVDRDAFDQISFVSDYILLKNNNLYSLYNIDNEKNELFIDSFHYSGDSEVSYIVNDEGNIEIYVGQDLQKTIELNDNE